MQTKSKTELSKCPAKIEAKPCEEDHAGRCYFCGRNMLTDKGEVKEIKCECGNSEDENKNHNKDRPCQSSAPKQDSWGEEIRNKLWYLFQECRAKEKHTFECKCMSKEGKILIDTISSLLASARKEVVEEIEKEINAIYILEERATGDLRTSPSHKQIGELTKYSKGFNASLDRILSALQELKKQ